MADVPAEPNNTGEEEQKTEEPTDVGKGEGGTTRAQEPRRRSNWSAPSGRRAISFGVSPQGTTVCFSAAQRAVSLHGRAGQFWEHARRLATRLWKQAMIAPSLQNLFMRPMSCRLFGKQFIAVWRKNRQAR
ncbi:MAG: hypothetical protein Q8M02_10625 [Candidatus Didemnitutus sp.]|nr:hypothetical protein [Candidatus Didemnitutus sp.]